ncbi:MAG: ABC transporter substrate-binding protein [Alphaproteobacteria bacterium]|nr:ABC transporter substrate-binding protein [Alphaproteobacteria bacterium]
MKKASLHLVAVAACAATAALSVSPARAAVTLEMAYMPIVPCSQLFVMEGMGWTKKAGINLKLTRFPNGPAIVQAIASGKMDTMCFGIGPAMVTRGKGIKLKVIAAGIVNQIAVIAQGDLVKYFDKHKNGKAALTAFTKDKGRKPKIASFPKGSVPDTVTRHWLLRSLGMQLGDVELIGMGASRVQQALLSRSVDAAGILEPILTIVESKLKGSKVVARATDMMNGQPGSTIAARENVIATQRAALVKLVELHIRATELLKKDPAAAAPHVKNFVAKGLIDVGTIQKSLESPSSNFEADPNRILKQTKYMHDFQKSEKIKTKVSVDGLFDLSIYRDAAKNLGK